VQPGGQEASVAMRLKVVVVDDEPDFCKSTCMLIEGLGHEAHAFHSATDVLQALEKIQPQLILSDLIMPQMDGFELARRLRQTVAGKQAVLVAITGFGDEEHRQLVVRAGFDFRLVKPVTIEELRWLLEEVVDKLGAR
jgi:CheY-like chemotaxis protein